MDAQQLAIIEPTKHPHAPICRELRAPDGQVFVPGLHRGGAAEQECVGGCAVLIDLARPVIVDLMIVIGDEEGCCRVCGLQIGV